MNAYERQRLAEVKQLLLEIQNPPSRPGETALLFQAASDLVDIIDRHERLASEGLTEGDTAYLEDCQEDAETQHGLPRTTALLEIIAKLQAALAAERQTRDVLLSDYVGDDVRLMQVREETAKEVLKMLEHGKVEVYRQGQTAPQQAVCWVALDTIDNIRKKFNLPAK